MILEKEIQATKLSATKKDFYQIYNELIDLASKISERWSPDSTNESDPGIVLLKCLTGIADKLNYTIDKNILEAFMPSAAQEESMRKLCEMMGYAIKYYQSATTDVTIGYTGEWKDSNNTVNSLVIPQFSTITDTDQEINYVTTLSCTLSSTAPTSSVTCIEGQLIQCETANNNLVGLTELDDNQKYYLQESQIAQNGIFIRSPDSAEIDWDQVDNLNAQPNTKKCYKFGYDSKEGLPYIQFPEDISSIINEGVYIYYIRTSGINGNISARTLNTLEKSANWDSTIEFNADNFTVSNTNAAQNGANPETITQAYNSYKKVIGTFNTLTTCRDYMNKIYNLVEETDNTTNLVSNIIASDIRDDINRAVNICTFDEYGMSYIDKTLTNKVSWERSSKSGSSGLEALNSSNNLHVGDIGYATTENKYYKCLTVNTEGSTWAEIKFQANQIDHFDLILYPFYPVFGLNDKNEYKKSFTYTTENKVDIETGLEEYKTLSHNIIFPTDQDKDILNNWSEIACIKNYVRLNAKITTTTKVSDVVWAIILNNIKTALFKTFNMRQVDFGEEIPFDDIESTIQNADERIKNVSLEEPDLVTKIMTVDNNEYYINIDSNESTNKPRAKQLLNKVLLRNILAGKVEMFNYDTNFVNSYTESAYNNNYAPLYPDGAGAAGGLTEVTKMESECEVSLTSSGELKNTITLNDNEYIKFRAPSFKTTLTYPAYVNYYWTGTELAANTEHKIVGDEKLYINYTESTASSDGNGQSSSSVKNIIYTKDNNIIIKPNFKLQNSADQHSAGTSWAKTTGYTFTDIPGMFSLGTNDQIEMREKVQVKLTSESSDYIPYYVYWEVNSANRKWADSETKKTEKFPFGSDGKYTLKDGEYFYFTDANKLDMAYYGSGTEIVAEGATVNLTKTITANSEISPEKILTYGISVVPWIKFSFNNQDKLTFNEYQYISLIKNDKLMVGLKLTDSVTENNKLNNTWKKVNSSTVKYQKSEDTSPKYLSAISVGDDTWEVRSGLDFNVGPNLVQTLHKQEFGTGDNKTTITDSITITDDDNAAKPKPSKKITPANKDHPLSIKTNYLIQSSTEVQDTHITIINEDETTTSKDDFKIKLFNNNTTTNISTFNNFGDYWTKLSFTDIKTGKDPELNISLLKDTTQYALLMIYYMPNDSLVATEKAYLSFSTVAGLSPVIFNKYDAEGNEIWWSSVSDNKYYLRDGMNIIKLNKSCKITINKNQNTNGGIIFSDLDLVNQTFDGSSTNIDYGINISLLNYEKEIDNITAAEQLLKDIRTLDTNYEFYYNLHIEKDRALDINTLLTGDDRETLTTSRIFYDYNNAVNKFVISEIDADYLSSGITLTKSSKL